MSHSPSQWSHFWQLIFEPGDVYGRHGGLARYLMKFTASSYICTVESGFSIPEASVSLTTTALAFTDKAIRGTSLE